MSFRTYPCPLLVVCDGSLNKMTSAVKLVGVSYGEPFIRLHNGKVDIEIAVFVLILFDKVIMASTSFKLLAFL